jgi:septum formation protein
MNNDIQMPYRPMQSLVLASTSPFRQALLGKLNLPFVTASPDIDESARPGESPRELVTRLAEEKARAVAHLHPDSLIIGSDQVACINDRILGKPGSRENAVNQLRAVSGSCVAFYTGLCLLDARNGECQLVCEPFHVHFRQLTGEMIERYLTAEEPYNCAGSFKSEGLGIALFERLEGEDPNALIGLPLIRLVGMLARAGIAVP